jgi:CubicO group peptidase (beta-lactamase class C family)
MKKMLVATLLLSTTIGITSASAVKEDVDVQAAIKLADAWVENRLDYDNVPGGSIAVVKDQEVVWSKGFGYARLEGNVKATADTTYSICSVSKLFTSIGAMQLRDQGKLSLDAPIADLLEWYDLPAHDAAEEPVTLRNILSHVSGLPREAVTSYWSNIDFPTQQQIRDGLKTQSAYYRPYDNFQYSNLGLTLVGEAVAAASGEDFHTYIKNNVLRPLEMNSTTTELPIAEHGKSFAAGYTLGNKKGKRDEVEPYTTNGIAPAAGFASSVNDLAKFASWQFRLQEQGGEEVLKATTLREMQRVHWTTPDSPGAVWGLGFAMSKVDGKTFIGHGGYCPGYRTAFLTRPQDKLAIIMMVNVNDVSPSSLASGVAGIVSSAINGAKTDAADDDSKTAEKATDYSRYEGTYGRDDFPYATKIVATSKGISMLGLFTDSPSGSVQRAKHISDHTFKRLGRDDKELYEIVFDVDDKGNIKGVWIHGQYAARL